MGLRAKTALFTSFVVVANVCGNAVVGWGIKREHFPAIAAGVLLLIAYTLARMALLSWADLSWVVPVTAIGYALNVLAGSVFLDEHVSALRWGGTFFIVCGTALVTSTERSR
jgi:drug/metabolite transporter (DMT)-like permease